TSFGTISSSHLAETKRSARCASIRRLSMSRGPCCCGDRRFYAPRVRVSGPPPAPRPGIREGPGLIPAALARGDTGRAGARTARLHGIHSPRRSAMIPLKTVLAPVLLSLLVAGGAFANEKVNINTADAATIERVLVNIGMSKAEAIVAYRKANGAFKSADELARVTSVGLKTVERNRDRIVVGAAR